MAELEKLTRILSPDNGPDVCASRLLQRTVDVLGDVDLVGLAKKIDEEQFQISNVAGPAGEQLQGVCFSIGEGFIGNVVATGQQKHWFNVMHDPRASFFTRRGIQVESVFCCPITWNQDVIGVLFAVFSSNVPESMGIMLEVLFSIAARDVLVELLEDHLQVRTTRLTSIMELSQAMTEVEDIRNILYILLDMSLNLIQGPFSCIAFKPIQGEAKVELLSRGIPRQKAAEIGRNLADVYMSKSVTEIKRQQVPMIRSLESTTVIECPMSFHGEVVAVISVAASNLRRLEEFSQLLYVLSVLGSAALHRVYSAKEQDWERDISLVQQSAQLSKNPILCTKVLEIQELAGAFATSLGLPCPVIESIRQAALLCPLDIESVSKVLPSLPKDITQILSDFQALCTDNAPGDITDGAQILALTAHHLGDMDVIMHNISRTLCERFERFLLQREVATQEILSDESQLEPAQGKNLAVDQLPTFESMTTREQEVLKLLATGKGNKEIAQALFISEHTVKNHLTNIFQKLGVNDRTQAIAFVYKYLQ